MSAPPTLLNLPARAAAMRLPWPLPALLAWGAGWTASWGAVTLGASPDAGAACGLLAGLVLAARCTGHWRQGLAASGFPLSAWAVGGAAAWPAWVWLLLALPLVWLYPLRAWRDAPFFPTPLDALQGLATALGGAAPQRVLDAGCGLGHGLRALQREWPSAQFTGLEWSRPLAWASAWRCPWARVQCGDMWAADWSDYELVYLFQRPESMARAYEKALVEMAPGTFLVSLEFAVPQVDALHCLVRPGQRSVWVYRLPGAAATRPDSTTAIARR